MSTASQITVGPVTFAEITGDAYAAISARLDAAGQTWAGLGRQLGMSRQNLQRAMRLQSALRLETLLTVLSGLAAAEKRRPRGLAQELKSLGLTLQIGADPASEEALLTAASLIRINRTTRKT